ncbi:MAG TPA: HlyD family secretion protein [Pseudomonas sabulinigri]|uniref:Multidrug resistance protein MdtA-like barrel-sandwich hybrid domain-containing protein n=1 Tax=marine sediment metagenome TaxID=412755 RepID=A0A0F9W7E2_9ZZZZ|nr:HlyD family secretion protein [Halopseudomonas sabulinigri]HEC51791.1 HlyD family secretion protein [Halopseudomonas sabulinigri]|tara:strand:- start:29465 stop:30529 length:1065 start_codon:yes stop_codon:yes gene_type:complete
MTPDQLFARWVRVSLIIFALVFAYFLAADLWMPLTPQSRVMHPVIRIAPQVSGQIIEVRVKDNQHVRAGDLLFSIDPRSYELAVQQAQLAMEAAGRDNEGYDASLAAAEAEVRSAQVQVNELAREHKRMSTLLASRNVSQQLYDQTQSSYQGAQSSLASAKARAEQLRVQRGITDEDNLRLRQARNDLERAELNLSYTEVRAETDGIVSNLQIKPGTYAAVGNSLAALVSDEADVIADFREKSLVHMAVGEEAAVVFDALPGHVFTARVTAVDAGTLQGQLMPDGSLAAPETSDRWVRDAQRQRIHLALDETPELLAQLPSGSRATVQLYPVGGLAALLGGLQIHLVSLMHYIY